MGGLPPAHFPGKKAEDLDVKDGFVFEKANPSNKKTVKEVADSILERGSGNHPSHGSIGERIDS